MVVNVLFHICKTSFVLLISIIFTLRHNKIHDTVKWHLHCVLTIKINSYIGHVTCRVLLCAFCMCSLLEFSKQIHAAGIAVTPFLQI